MNENLIRIYDSTGTTPIDDPERLLDRAEQIRFSTGYPGGYYGSFSCFIPCDPTRAIPIKWNQLLIVRNGLETVWRGKITAITLIVRDGASGIDIAAVGELARWAYLAGHRRWIDRRYSSNVNGTWTPVIDTVSNGAKFDFDQNDQLTFKPKKVDFNTSETAYIIYQKKQSSNVVKVVFDYDLQLAAEVNPVRAKKYTQAGATYSANLPNMIDGRAATSQTVSMATNDLLYIGVPIDGCDGITGLRFDFGATVNANTAALTLEYFTNGHTWQSVAITDGTSTGGKTWAQDGTVSFTAIDGLHWTEVNGSQEFVYFRFSVDNALTANVVINDIYVQRSQAWTLFLNDVDAGSTLWSVNTAGTGTQSITLSPTSDYIAFGMTANANQRVTGEGIYGKITDLAVYCENPSGAAVSTVTDIVKAYMGLLAITDYTYIANNTYALDAVGFVSDDNSESFLDAVTRVAQYSSGNDAYSFGINDVGLPYFEVYPALTDYDYAVRLSEKELDGMELVLSADYGELYNSVFISYTDDSGKTGIVTSSDDAGLDDSASITKYSSRKYLGSAGNSSSAGAIDYGKQVLKSVKDLQYYMRGPLVLRGTVRKKDGTRVPVSQVRAGKRVKIENFSTDIGDTLGAGLTFLITGTEYDDDAGTLSVTTGVPDDLAIYLAKRSEVGGR